MAETEWLVLQLFAKNPNNTIGANPAVLDRIRRLREKDSRSFIWARKIIPVIKPIHASDPETIQNGVITNLPRHFLLEIGIAHKKPGKRLHTTFHVHTIPP